MKPHSILRVLHQWSGLALATFVVMYAVSGLVIIAPGVIPNRFNVRAVDSPRVAAVEGRLPQAPADAPQGPAFTAFAEVLSAELGLRGRFELARWVDDGWEIVYSRPGHLETVRWTPGAPTVELRTSSEGLANTVTGLHELHGFRGPTRFVVWAVLLDLVSVAMLTFAGSGVYLWWVRKRKNRMLGAVLLGSCSALTLTVVMYLALRP